MAEADLNWRKQANALTEGLRALLKIDVPSKAVFGNYGCPTPGYIQRPIRHQGAEGHKQLKFGAELKQALRQLA